MWQKNVLNQVKRVFLASAQAVKLVDNDALDRAGADFLHQLGNGRPCQV